MRALILAAVALAVCGCASSPNSKKASDVSPTLHAYTTEKFDVEGGHFRQWTRRNFAPPTVESPPYEIRFVITGINMDKKWSSDIGFFFEGPAGDEETKISKNGKAEYRLRFSWDAKKRALFPKMGYVQEEREKSVGRFNYPIALSQPVTITLRRQNEEVLILSLDGHGFVHFEGKLELMTVHASGLKGEITLPVK